MKTYSYSLSKVLFALLVLVGLALSGHAQEGGRNKAIYAEALGSGLTLSLNYDFRFKPTQSGLGMRAGIGGGSFSDNNSDVRAGIVTAPILVNYLIGERRVAFEAGAGITMLYATASGTDSGTGEFIRRKGFGAFGSINTGLRLQPIRNGAIFRLTWTPVVNGDGFRAGWFGVSLGYAFK
ncbi:hypothetical protein GCM10027347_45340 [Larkinella harenae]